MGWDAIMEDRESYRPSELRFWLLHHMLDEVYCEGHGAGNGDDPSVYGLEEFPPYYRHNDVTGIGRCFDDGLFMRGPVETVDIENEDGSLRRETRSRFNYQATRKGLEDLVDRGILVKDETSNVRNRKLYFPNETDAGLTALVDYLGTFAEYAGGRLRVMGGPEVQQPWPYTSFLPLVPRGLSSHNPVTVIVDMLLSTSFCRRTVTRGLILRRIESSGKTLFIKISTNDGEYKVGLPVRGRYPLTYEDMAPFETFLENCNSIGETVKGLTGPELYLDLVNGDRSLADSSTARKASKGVKTAVLNHLERMREGVEAELLRMREMRSKAEAAGETDARFWFGEDPGDDLRRESWGSRPVLDEGDMEAMRESAEVWSKVGPGGSWARTSSYPDGLVDSAIHWYPEVIDDMVVLPTLCLIQMSPSALISFSNSGSGWGKSRRFIDPWSGDVGVMNQELYLAALSDLISARCRQNMRGWDTRYVGRGEMEIIGERVHGDMVFEINRGRYLVYRGCEMSQAYLLDNLGRNSLVVGTGDRLDIGLLGGFRYSTHLLNTVESVRGRGILAGYGDPQSNFHNVLLNTVMTGGPGPVFRPHRYRGDEGSGE